MIIQLNQLNQLTTNKENLRTKKEREAVSNYPFELVLLPTKSTYVEINEKQADLFLVTMHEMSNIVLDWHEFSNITHTDAKKLLLNLSETLLEHPVPTDYSNYSLGEIVQSVCILYLKNNGTIMIDTQFA